MINTKIEWCDATLNFWWGCTKVSPACDHCYAEGFAKRTGRKCWGPGVPRWKRELAKVRKELETIVKRAGDLRPRVFVGSMMDWLDPEVPAEWLCELLSMLFQYPQCDYLLLSKRPELWRKRIEAILDPKGDALPSVETYLRLMRWREGTPPPNIWVGTTVENKPMADLRIPDLIGIPALVRFLSCEPLLGSAHLNILKKGDTPKIHWVIVGGENGPRVRSLPFYYTIQLFKQCRDLGIPFFFKGPGKILEKEILEIPVHLRHEIFTVREFPRLDGGVK